MFSITTLDPAKAPNSPRRLAQVAVAAGYDVTVTEAREGGKRAWSVRGTRGDRRFQAYWGSTEEGGCKAVGQVVSDGAGKGDRSVKSRELTTWISA